MRIALLTGGGDKPYALGMASCLVNAGIAFDFIGSDELDCPLLHENSLAAFYNLRGDQNPKASSWRKLARVLTYYRRLLWYAFRSKSRLFHILWNNKFEYLDRTLVLLYYRLLGKRLVFTAHNVNIAKRDGRDTAFNRLTLRIQYRLLQHIFVHTDKMREELHSDFGVPLDKCTVIPFGLNETLPNTGLTPDEARRKLGFGPEHKVLLFFGNITPYKGLEYLVQALKLLSDRDPSYRLVIAGRQKDHSAYWKEIRIFIVSNRLENQILERIEFIPDPEAELYVKASDVLVLPYTHIFQSGVLFVAYNFGLPVVATDVGSLKEEIIPGETGFLCPPRDPEALAETLDRYFESELFRKLPEYRGRIRDYAADKYSWRKVGEELRKVYESLDPSIAPCALSGRSSDER